MSKKRCKFDAVLFDLDGTFADTALDLGFALNQVLLSQGKASLPLSTIRPFVSKGAPGLIALGFGIDANHPEYETLRTRLLTLYQRRLVKDTQLFSGIAELITRLEAEGTPWGIITNKPDFLTQPLMKQLQLETRASVIFSGDTFAEKKPHPLPLLNAAKTLNLDPSGCVYIGDDERDIIAANAANMYSIAALWGYIVPGENPKNWPAKLSLKHSEELLDALFE